MSITPLSNQKEAEIPKKLINSIRENNAVILVGSGLSKGCGFPSWSSLIELLLTNISKVSSRFKGKTVSQILSKLENQPQWIAEILKHESKESYTSTLKEIFSEYHAPEFSSSHALISVLPFRGYLTTNYDQLIEDYVRIFDRDSPNVYTPFEESSIIRFIRSPRRFILKLHGCALKDPGQLVLTSSDYYRLLRDVKYERILAYLFQRYTILTIGFGLKDPDLKNIIEERSYLYGNDCPPIYAVISDENISNLEKDAYKDIYNIHIIEISPKNNFIELVSFLFSLYCLVYSIDSNSILYDIEKILKFRTKESSYIISEKDIKISHDLNEAITLLSIFKEPINIDLFTSICSDYGLNISSAVIRLISSIDPDRNIITNKRIIPNDNQIEYIAKWIGIQLETIPIKSYPRYLTVYYKATINQFSKTLSSLLSKKVGWNNVLGNKETIMNRFYRISEFFKQSGKWKEWLSILDKAEKYVDKNQELLNEVLRNKLWIFFWTRRYDDAKTLLDKSPQIDDMGDKGSYRERLRYMESDNLLDLIEDLESQKNLDYFGVSLLGRTYARIATKRDNSEKESFLKKAKTYLIQALEEAKKGYDLIEISVQSWYLACVLIELNEREEAQKYLAETKRLDESIMERIPGIAWLNVAEYLIIKNDPEISNEEKELIKKEAIQKMEALGMVNAKQFVENDYFY